MALLKSKTPPLDAERVRNLQDEIDAHIDDLAAQEAKSCPGIPVGVIRNIITNRSGGCQCRAYLNLQEQA